MEASILPTFSKHALAAALIGGSTAFGDLFVGPVLSPAYDCGAGLVVAALGAHAATTVARRYVDRPLPFREVLRLAVSSLPRPTERVSFEHSFLRFACGLEQPRALLARGIRALLRRGTGSAARRLVGGVLSASIPWAGVALRIAKAAHGATAGWMFVRSLEEATARGCSALEAATPTEFSLTRFAGVVSFSADNDQVRDASIG